MNYQKLKIKYQEPLNNLSLEELIKKIEVPNFEVEKYIVDFKYNIKINNNTEEVERIEKILVFGLKDRLKIFQNKDYKEFFIDITFKIVPKVFRPYKLMSLAAVNHKEKKGIFSMFCIIKIFRQNLLL